MFAVMTFRPFSLRDDSPEDKKDKEKEPKSRLEEKFLETRTIMIFGEISQKVGARSF